jgi:Na+/H+ antiporter NhaD/arsenite permease-like protein
MKIIINERWADLTVLIWVFFFFFFLMKKKKENRKKKTEKRKKKKEKRKKKLVYGICACVTNNFLGIQKSQITLCCMHM